MKHHSIRYRDWLERKPTPTPTPTPEPEPKQELEPAPAPTPEPEVEAVVAAPVVEAPIVAEEPVLLETPVAEAPLNAEPAAAEPDAPAPPAEYLMFRVARELFALPLDAVEEAIDVEQVQPMPEMRAAMLGVIPYRGALVPLYAPAGPLGLSGDRHRTALIFVTPRGRVALAVDDVDDVLVISPDEIRRPPVDFGDHVLTGVAWRAHDLVGILDATALVDACRAEPVLETA